MLRSQIEERRATERAKGMTDLPGGAYETKADLDLSGFDPTVNVQPELFPDG